MADAVTSDAADLPIARKKEIAIEMVKNYERVFELILKPDSDNP